ncbi:MAG: YIP1 family protein [Gemmatimonadales bacterium]
MTAAAETTQAGPADLIEIFYAPSAVFARRRDGKFGLPYLALVILGIIIFVATKNLLQPVIDAEITRSIAQAAAKSKMTPERVASATSVAQKIGSFGLIAFYIIGPFVLGLLVWVAGSLARVPKIGTVAIMLATFSIYPRLLGGIVGAILAAVLPEGSLTSAAAISVSPARFVDPTTSPGLYALMGRFDLFLLWGVVLVYLGVRAATGATKQQAWTTAIGAWVIASLPTIYGALKAG